MESIEEMEKRITNMFNNMTDKELTEAGFEVIKGETERLSLQMK
ncbi:hypothetical protein BACERE00183_04059 [Bacillus cereus]|nr:hypothetical protein BACERE00183_04059 [Bacillus cereus]